MVGDVHCTVVVFGSLDGIITFLMGDVVHGSYTCLNICYMKFTLYCILCAKFNADF